MSSTITPATVAHLADAVATTDDALALAEHRLAVHAVGLVHLAALHGLPIVEEEPMDTLRRLLAHMEAGGERRAVADYLRGHRCVPLRARYALADAIERGDHLEARDA